ncbi:hypothetical protein F4779DRAFT_632975 [Xylariaceae sp. FL0662B]|nr:hypothetical protein F4779DRAFT_632975 [Xylariaceae sp. FL0662B]
MPQDKDLRSPTLQREDTLHSSESHTIIPRSTSYRELARNVAFNPRPPQQNGQHYMPSQDLLTGRYDRDRRPLPNSNNEASIYTGSTANTPGTPTATWRAGPKSPSPHHSLNNQQIRRAHEQDTARSGTLRLDQLRAPIHYRSSRNRKPNYTPRERYEPPQSRERRKRRAPTPISPRGHIHRRDNSPGPTDRSPPSLPGPRSPPLYYPRTPPAPATEQRARPAEPEDEGSGDDEVLVGVLDNPGPMSMLNASAPDSVHEVPTRRRMHLSFIVHLPGDAG